MALGGHDAVEVGEQATPLNSRPAMMAMASSVLAAFLAWGSSKAGTPSEMASVPVRAAQPEEKRPQQQEDSAEAAEAGRLGGRHRLGLRHVARRTSALTSATPKITSIAAMNT